MPQNAVDTGTHVYFIRYRKILTILCLFLLLFGLPFKIYNAPVFDKAHTFQDIGYVLDTALIFLAVPLWMLLSIRKTYKLYKNEDEWKKLQ